MKTIALDDDAQRQLICEAHVFASEAAWTAFGAALQPWTALASKTIEALQDPTTCE